MARSRDSKLLSRLFCVFPSFTSAWFSCLCMLVSLLPSAQGFLHGARKEGHKQLISLFQLMSWEKVGLSAFTIHGWNLKEESDLFLVILPSLNSPVSIPCPPLQWGWGGWGSRITWNDRGQVPQRKRSWMQHTSVTHGQMQGLPIT